MSPGILDRYFWSHIEKRFYGPNQLPGEGEVSGRSDGIGDDKQGPMVVGEEISASIIDGKSPRSLLEMTHEDLPEPKGIKGDEFLDGQGGLAEQDGPVSADLLSNSLIGKLSGKGRDILTIQEELGIGQVKPEHRLQALVLAGFKGSILN